jgi:hypothetical protein
MRRPDLLADCGSCAALCCVAIAFEQSEEFACDKPAGERCAQLTDDDRCAIHGQRAQRGFVGCTLYDCYGAGQRATRQFGRAASVERDSAFFAFRDVHELLFLLTEAAALCPVSQPELRTQVAAMVGVLDAARDPSPTELAHHRAMAQGLLRRVGRALGGRREARRLRLL